ncbi:hypothetical protein ACFOWE_31230 [Planomonospora corallina]|uniref:Uncharacterized protein n=1 Tax=Planomonospora corallina TaxID=1806052 RepID=A0ABV8IHV7_9ACTN
MTHRVTLNAAEFKRRAHALGLFTKSEQAAAVGVHNSIHSRALRGERELNVNYVINVLLLLGDAHVRGFIRELFVIADDNEKAAS